MRWLRSRPDVPERPEAALLRVLGATDQIPAPAFGCWVYGLLGHDGETFYIGQSENLLTRLGHWHKVYGDTLAGVWLVACANEWDMSVTEDFLISRLKPRVNIRGASDELAQIRARVLSRKQQRGAAMGAARGEAYAAAGREGDAG